MEKQLTMKQKEAWDILKYRYGRGQWNQFSFNTEGDVVMCRVIRYGNSTGQWTFVLLTIDGATYKLKRRPRIFGSWKATDYGQGVIEETDRRLKPWRK